MRHRRLLERLYRSGISSADPRRAVARALEHVSFGARPWVIAMGKGASPMAQGALHALAEGSRVPLGGVAVVPAVEGPSIRPLHVVVGEHPLPGAQSAIAADAIAALIARILPSRRGESWM